MKEHRKKLRNNATSQEKLLWNYLKGSQFHGLKFRRQYSIGGYVIDFYCNSHKIGIELDGNHHLQEDIKRYDTERTYYLESQQIQIIRFKNQQVDNDIENVLEQLKNFIF